MNEIEEHILRRSLEGGWIISRIKITPDLSHAEGLQRLVLSHKARYDDRYTFTTPCMQREPRAVCVGGRLSQRRESRQSRGEPAEVEEPGFFAQNNLAWRWVRALFGK